MSNKTIESYGYNDFFKKQIEEFDIKDDLIISRVTCVHREQYKIINEYGEKNAKLKGSLFYNGEFNTYPAVGDFVLVKYNPYGEDIIYHVLERKSKFSRLDSFNEKEQIVAANFDYVFIMTSLNHDFNIRRIERYLSAAVQSGAKPVIILTKADLCTDYKIQKTMVEEIASGIPVQIVSTITMEGFNNLMDYFKPNTTIVFLGSSGVGKSSLINAIAGEEIMSVNTIREDDSKGRHTTTHRQLIMLKNGSMVIDTPGMRELGMWDTSDGLDSTFSDIEIISRKCKFRNCRHQSEIGCAVKEAVESGEISKERWNNYLKLKREAKFAEEKESVNTRLKEKSKEKNLSKLQREFKKKSKM